VFFCFERVVLQGRVVLHVTERLLHSAIDCCCSPPQNQKHNNTPTDQIPIANYTAKPAATSESLHAPHQAHTNPLYAL